MAPCLSVRSPGFAPGEILAVVCAVGLPALSYGRIRPARRELMATGLALLRCSFVGLGYIFGKSYHTDVVAAVHRATELLIGGQNPYSVFDLPAAIARFGLDPELATHLENGSVVHTFNYPAMSFLQLVPWVWLGLTDIRWVYLIETLLIPAVPIPPLRAGGRLMALPA